MTEEQRNDFTQLLMLLIERTTTLSVRVETMRVLLEERGVFSGQDFDEKYSQLRSHWDLQNHPHPSLSPGLGMDEYLTQIRRLLESAGDKQ